MVVAIGFRHEIQFWGGFSILEICNSERGDLRLSLRGPELLEVYQLGLIGVLEGVAFYAIRVIGGGKI